MKHLKCFNVCQTHFYYYVGKCFWYISAWPSFSRRCCCSSTVALKACYSMSAVSMRYRSSCVLFGVESEDLIKSQAKDIKHVCSGERGIRRLYEALFISLCGEVSLSFCRTTFAILFEINSIKISISYLWVPRTGVTY